MGVNNCILFVVILMYVLFKRKGDVIDEISRTPLRRRLAIYTQIAQPNSKMQVNEPFKVFRGQKPCPAAEQQPADKSLNYIECVCIQTPHTMYLVPMSYITHRNRKE